MASHQLPGGLAFASKHAFARLMKRRKTDGLLTPHPLENPCGPYLFLNSTKSFILHRRAMAGTLVPWASVLSLRGSSMTSSTCTATRRPPRTRRSPFASLRSPLAASPTTSAVTHCHPLLHHQLRLRRRPSRSQHLYLPGRRRRSPKPSQLLWARTSSSSQAMAAPGATTQNFLWCCLPLFNAVPFAELRRTVPSMQHLDRHLHAPDDVSNPWILPPLVSQERR